MPKPTKLTPEVQERIIHAILAGNYFETACGYAGVAKSTAYEWLERGEGRNRNRQRTPLYAEFADAVRLAEAQAEVQAVAIIRQGLPENPRLALDFLARRHPERWGQRDTLTVLKKLANDLDKMTDDELYAIVNRSAGVSPGTGGPDEAPGARAASGDGNGLK